MEGQRNNWKVQRSPSWYSVGLLVWERVGGHSDGTANEGCPVQTWIFSGFGASCDSFSASLLFHKWWKRSVVDGPRHHPHDRTWHATLGSALRSHQSTRSWSVGMVYGAAAEIRRWRDCWWERVGPAPFAFSTPFPVTLGRSTHQRRSTGRTLRRWRRLPCSTPPT